MTKLFDKLSEAGLPVISASEDGAISMEKMTEEQWLKYKDILHPPDYAELRCREYPSIGDQLDMMYHDAVDGTTVWVEKIKSVKEKYPKPALPQE